MVAYLTDSGSRPFFSGRGFDRLAKRSQSDDSFLLRAASTPSGSNGTAESCFPTVSAKTGGRRR